MTRIAAAFCFLTILACGPARAAKPAWVQMTTLGAQVRVVTTEATCPTLKVDSRNLAMSLRAAPSDAFANRVCQVTPEAAKVAQRRMKTLRAELHDQVLTAWT